MTATTPASAPASSTQTSPASSADHGAPRTALVTGASSGIGEDTARTLQALGYTVYGAARRTDLADILRPLNHEETAACVTAERALARALGGSCQVPLAAYCVMEDGLLTLNGLVGHPDGSVIIEASAQAPDAYANALGRAVAKRLADDGAEELIAAVLAEQQ